MKKLLELKPQVFTEEYIDNESIFYTIKISPYSIYINHYFDDSILYAVVFNGEEKLPSIEGSYEQIYNKISSLIYEGRY